MKRLLSFGISCVLFVSMGALFVTPQSVSAQTNSSDTQYISFKNQGLAVIESQIAYLKSRLTDVDLKQKWGGGTDPRWLSYLDTNPKVTDLLVTLKGTFAANFDSAKNGGSNPDVSYTAAMLSVVQGLNRNIPPGNIIREDINTITRALNATANATTQAAIDSGDPAAIAAAQANASQLQSARAAQSTPPGLDRDGKCTSLMNATFLDCVDTGISWFIKNTILQIAGFSYGSHQTCSTILLR